MHFEFIVCFIFNATSGDNTEAGGDESDGPNMASAAHSVMSSGHSPFEKALIRTLTPKKQASVNSNGSGAANMCTANGIDAGGGKWAIEADLHSSFLRCSLVYMDIYKIPRNHLR